MAALYVETTLDVLVKNAGVTCSIVRETTFIDVIKGVFEVNYFEFIRLN